MVQLIIFYFIVPQFPVWQIIQDVLYFLRHSGQEVAEGAVVYFWFQLLADKNSTDMNFCNGDGHISVSRQLSQFRRNYSELLRCCFGLNALLCCQLIKENSASSSARWFGTLKILWIIKGKVQMTRGQTFRDIFSSQWINYVQEHNDGEELQMMMFLFPSSSTCNLSFHSGGIKCQLRCGVGATGGRCLAGKHSDD